MRYTLRMEERIVVQEDLTRKSGYEVTVHTHRVYQMVYFVLGVIETVLGIRFFFKLFGANPDSLFVWIIYGVSNVLLFPFSGVFQGSTTVNDAVTVQKMFEPSAIVAGIMYLLLAWGLSRLLLIVRSKPHDPQE